MQCVTNKQLNRNMMKIAEIRNFLLLSIYIMFFVQTNIVKLNYLVRIITYRTHKHLKKNLASLFCRKGITTKNIHSMQIAGLFTFYSSFKLQGHENPQVLRPKMHSLIALALSTY